MHHDHLTSVAITMGDPAGVGPEIIVGAWAGDVMDRWCRPVVVGCPEVLRRAAALLGTGAEVVEVDGFAEIQPSRGVIPCVVGGSPEAAEVQPGVIDPRGGRAAYDALAKATRAALDGQVDAIVTAPLHKEALNQAGHLYPGHTEILAELCGVDDYAMMLYMGPGEPLRSLAGLAVVHVTLHVALADVFGLLSAEGILAKARLADEFVRRMKGSPGRIGVCALNPHGGEGGLFGREEIEVIAPAVQRGVDEGLLLEGPLPVDTIMIQARDGKYDAVVAMYHDQGHIAVKLMGMHRAVNVTLGLPIIRVSVAHGTAFDLAWQGRADCGSMIEAVRVASRLAQRKDEQTRP